jgi:hypothetical protein
MPERPSTGSGGVAGPGVGGFAASLKKGGGPSLFWSEVTVQGRPRVLVLDAVTDRDGWEAGATQRIAASLVRRDIPVVGGTPVVVSAADDIPGAIRSADNFNCIFLTARAEGSPSAAECWRALQDSLAGETKLFAMCTWDSADTTVSAEVLSGEDTFAPVAVAQQEPMTGRGASLFFMKFFAELDMHSEATKSMSGKMVWFGHSKAREIMRRRHYDGRVGLRS